VLEVSRQAWEPPCEQGAKAEAGESQSESEGKMI
jgi:hypothetical protein